MHSSSTHAPASPHALQFPTFLIIVILSIPIWLAVDYVVLFRFRFGFLVACFVIAFECFVQCAFLFAIPPEYFCAVEAASEA